MESPTPAIRIPRESIESSSLKAIGFDPKRQILAVEFKSGAVFHYAPFTAEQALAFYGAPSRGRYFATHIKGQIHGAKMTGPCLSCGDQEGWIGDTCTDCGCATYIDAPRPARRGTDE